MKIITKIHQESIGVVLFFHVGLVPPKLFAFEDYRWDLIMQGQGLETLVVHNSRNLSHCVAHGVGHQAQRLLRHLHGLLVMHQSCDPEKLISAAESIMDWLNAHCDWGLFDVGEAEPGSVREEGEEENQRDDDESVDLQDQRSDG